MQSVVQIQTSSAMFARRAAQTFACSSAVLELQQARAEVARPRANLFPLGGGLRLGEKALISEDSVCSALLVAEGGLY